MTYLQNLSVISTRYIPQVNDPAYAEGKVFYDSTDHALSVQSDVTGVTLQVGQEQWIRVRNNSGATIPNGAVVYQTGVIGKRPTIALAMADNISTSSVIAVATHDIGQNTDGYVTTFGLVRDLDTQIFNDGDIVYLSASVPGGYTKTIPTEPNSVIRIGTVADSDNNQGMLLVRIGASQDTAASFNALRVLSDLHALSRRSTRQCPRRYLS